MKKPIRTISGVAPLAVMVPPRKCNHGTCIYCPTFTNAPQSYTPESPAVLRARESKFDPKVQVLKRLETFEAMKHPTDKIELIIMGGTFLQFPRDFQFQFIKACYDALNGVDSETLEEAKKINETAEKRCVAMCIETRPDFCSDEEIKDMLEWGTTRIEIGVQILDDNIYRKINRGHTVQDVIDATKRLKRAGFKLGYHLMPGLPGSNPEKDLEVYHEIFSNEKYKPDQIKIYPCQVMKNSPLEQMYYKGKYTPYDVKTIFDIIVTMLRDAPNYVRIMRIMREIPSAYLVAGTLRIDLRKEIEDYIRKEKIEIKEIRFREIGFVLREKKKIGEELKIKETKYNASDGEEIFLEKVDENDTLFGLLRLRFDEDLDYAMVREVHVYGPTLKLGEEGAISQHTGIGKELIAEAEKLSREKGYGKIKIISGIGVREYYKKLGYSLDEKGIYMEKTLD